MSNSSLGFSVAFWLQDLKSHIQIFKGFTVWARKSQKKIKNKNYKNIEGDLLYSLNHVA